MDINSYNSFALFFGVCLQLFQANGGFTTKIEPRPLWNATYTDKLRQDLLLNYDKFARPTSHENSIRMKFNITIRHVEVNEFKSTMTVYGFTTMLWKDDKLKWNTSDYGGIVKLHMAVHEIWQPDMYLYNSGVSTAISHFNSPCLVFFSGDVLWSPPTQFTVLCDLNLKYWPFDTQKCEFHFASWTYNGDEIDLQLMYNTSIVKVDQIIKSTEWAIGEISIKLQITVYPCCGEPYPTVIVTVNLIRRSPSYKVLIITPAFVIIGLILSTFWLPPQSREKIILNTCTAIIVTLFLLYFAQKIPAMGSHTPLVVFFYSSCLWIVCFSIIESIVVIWLSRTQHTKPLPWIIKQQFTGCIGKWLGLSNYIRNTVNICHPAAEEMRTDFEDNELNDDKQFISLRSKEQYQSDWILLAAVIDRISFIFYSFLFLILSLSYFV